MDAWLACEKSGRVSPRNCFSVMDASIDNSLMKDLQENIVVAVIPCYLVESTIGEVIASLPPYVKHVIVVDDASPDGAAGVVMQLSEKDRRIILLRHEKNQGVGGAMLTGFRMALELNADIVVKIDGDGQMDATYIPNLLAPIMQGHADYTKGNRFRDFQALQKMPVIRRIGNISLGFLTKAATGYWNLFDPTNGFVAIHGKVLAQLPLAQIDRTYFFETSMLAHLYLLGAVVKDVPIPARYGNEGSNLSIQRSLFEFPLKLLMTLLRRLILRNLIYDFSMASIYLIVSLPLLLFGFIFGMNRWVHYATINVPAPTGTVMLPTLSVLLGIQFLLAAIEIDLRSVPKDPISS
jgi:dolichol-phosphate mannosyltransferase